MILKYRDFYIYIVSLLALSCFLYFSIYFLNTKQIEIIKFTDSDIHEEFEIEITKNIHDINNYLKEYLFIESYLLKRKKNQINVQIKLKKYFALNNYSEEVIFYDNTTAPVHYFKTNYLDSINLIDISKNSIYINNYLSENYHTLSSLFNINKIEYIDDRRYNLVLSNGKIIMLPKVIDSKLLYFIKNNIDLIDKNTNYMEFLDLRNFHKKTIRLK